MLISASDSKQTIDQATLCSDLLDWARQGGASDAKVVMSYNTGYEVSVRLQEIDTVEYHQDITLGMSVFKGRKKAHFSTTDLSKKALKEALSQALDVASYTQEDPCSALPDKADLAVDFDQQLDVFHPWDLSVEQAIARALEAESVALDMDNAIDNSEGMSISTSNKQRFLANSHGFAKGYARTSHYQYLSLIAKQKGKMQRDGHYDVKSHYEDLLGTKSMAQKAVENTKRRIGARAIGSQKTPVMFAPEVATTLIQSFLSAISGSNIYRKSSFLLDQIDQAVFPSWFEIMDDPFVPRGLSSVLFDSEGVKVQPRTLIEKGILQSYLLDSYAARKLKLKTTGHAGGAHNIVIPGQEDFDTMLKNMGTGFVVTELMGQGVNPVTGDYSRAAGGYWVKDGVFDFAVEGVTIAGNLKDMYQNIVAVGKDYNLNSSIATGSILIEQMALSGS